MKIEIEDYGTLPTGETVKKFLLTNNNNIEVTLIDYGAILVGLKCPDRYEVYSLVLICVGFHHHA